MIKHDWVVVCDATNNPPEQIDQNILVVDIVKPPVDEEVRRQCFESVWDAICDKKEAPAMRLRSYLLRSLGREIKRLGQNPETICQQLQISNNRLDDIMQGRIDRLSYDQLTGFCRRIGLNVERLMHESLER